MTREDIVKLIPDESRKWIEQSTALAFNEYLTKLPEEGRLVEIGTGGGDSTLIIALVKPKWIIYTIDVFDFWGIDTGWEATESGKGIVNRVDLPMVRARWEGFGANNIIQIAQDAKKVPWELPVNAIFIDGNHSYESCKKDFEKYFPFLIDGGFIFFHDYWRDDFGVKQFVGELCQKDWMLLYSKYMAVIAKEP